MTALWALTLANIRSYVRDRAALFWTLAFPLIFIFMFGFIFQGGGDFSVTIAWVDEDRTPASSELRAAFDAVDSNELVDLDLEAARVQMQDGEVSTIVAVPAGYGEAVAAASAGSGPPAAITVYTAPSRESATAAVLLSW